MFTIFTVYIYLLFEIVFSEQEDKCAQIKSAISNCTESKSFIHLSNQNYNFTCIVLWEAIHVIYWYIHLEFIFLIAYLTY